CSSCPASAWAAPPRARGSASRPPCSRRPSPWAPWPTRTCWASGCTRWPCTTAPAPPRRCCSCWAAAWPCAACPPPAPRRRPAPPPTPGWPPEPPASPRRLALGALEELDRPQLHQHLVEVARPLLALLGQHVLEQRRELVGHVRVVQPRRRRRLDDVL